MIAIVLLVLLAGGAPPVPNPAQPVDYASWLNERFAVPEKDNAADLYRQAAAAFEADFDLLDLAKTPSDWSDRYRISAKPWLRKSARALDLLQEGAQRRACYFALEPGADLLDAMTRIDDMSALSSMTLALHVRMLVAAGDGDLDAVTRDLDTCLRVARHLQSQPVLISHLGGNMTGIRTYTLVTQLAALGNVDQGELAKRLRRSDRTPTPPTNALLGDVVLLLDAYQRHGKGPAADGRYRLELPNDIEVDWETLDIVETMGEAANHTPAGLHAEQLKMLATVEELWNGGPAAVADFRTNLKARLAEHGLTNQEHAISGYLQTLDLVQSYKADRAGCRAALALYAHHARAGSWPKKLDAVKGESRRRMIDPFTGTLMKYRLVDGTPLLYSIGTDRVDGQGQVRTNGGLDKGDRVYLPFAQ